MPLAFMAREHVVHHANTGHYTVLEKNSERKAFFSSPFTDFQQIVRQYELQVNGVGQSHLSFQKT